MTRMTPEQEAEYAINFGVARGDLPMGAQLAYDRLKAEREAAGTMPPDASPWPPPRTPRRSSPDTRAAILEMFKRGNAKYAKPFEKDRLAAVSVMGGNWEEYGQVVLQMAILDTLLSIEEKLADLGGSQPAPDGHNADDAYAPQHRAGVPGSPQSY